LCESRRMRVSKKGKKELPKYWYVEQLVHQLPSSYIDEPEPEEVTRSER